MPAAALWPCCLGWLMQELDKGHGTIKKWPGRVAGEGLRPKTLHASCAKAS